MKGKKLFWTSLYFGNWAAIFGFWLNGSGTALISGSSADTLIALGRIAGLAATYMILLQFFLMGRLPWLERLFGLDNLSRLHQRNGKVAFYFLLAHPLLLTVGYSRISGLGLWQQFLDMTGNLEHVRLAFIGLLLFLTVISTSIYIVRSRLRYESWYFVHLITYLAVFLSLFHQFKNGADLTGNNVFYTYWVALYTLTFTGHLTFRFIRPLYLFRRHAFMVSRIVRESPNAVSAYITGIDLGSFDIRPGQFMILRFLTGKLWWQAHPFSLSLPADGKEIRITAKELGDFTRQIKDLKPGTKVVIDGPYGVFTDLFSLSSRVLLIAGGIGITPIRPLMEEMLKKGKDVILLYGNKNSAETVFKDELSGLEEKYHTRISYIMSAEPDAGETGRIDADKIQKLVPDWRDREVYVCGPENMNKAVVAFFRQSGVEPARIHHEKFAF